MFACLRPLTTRAREDVAGGGGRWQTGMDKSREGSRATFYLSFYPRPVFLSSSVD